MSLEVANFIHQLIATNPTISDFVKEGDDHLRMVKRTLLNTFSQVMGPVLVSHTALNNIPLDTNGSLQALAATVEHRGTIKMHDLVNVPVIPAGWALCDGQTVEGYGVVPDLRGKFIRGWTPTEGAGSLGGSDSLETSPSGGHTPVVQTHALTVAELPAHDHPLPTGCRFVDTAGTNDGITGGPQAGHRVDNVVSVGLSGGGQAHGHGAEAVPDHTHTQTLPRYYSIVFIVKTTSFALP